MLSGTTMFQYTAGALTIANLWVSVSVIRSPFYSAGQKLAQCLIVWLIPLLGVIGIWAFLRAQYNWQKYNTRAYPERSEKGVAVAVQDAIHESGGHAGGD